jgi:hypothetical protein
MAEEGAALSSLSQEKLALVKWANSYTDVCLQPQSSRNLQPAFAGRY